MKLNFNFPFTELDGSVIAESNAGVFIANSLAASPEGDSLKLWDWALKLNKKEALDLDPSDTQTLKTFIEQNKNYNVLVKAQCLAIFK